MHMKYITFLSMACAAFFSAVTVNAIYLEYGTVKGESAAEADPIEMEIKTLEVEVEGVYQQNETDLDFIKREAQKEDAYVQDNSPNNEQRKQGTIQTADFDTKTQETDADDMERTRLFEDMSDDDDSFFDIEYMIDELEEDISETERDVSEDDVSDDDEDDDEDDDVRITIRGDELRGWDPKKKEEILGLAPRRADEVDDDTDFAFLVMQTAHDDAAMESISFNFEKIDIAYQSSGKLLGFIPIIFTEDIELDTDGDDAGRVKVRLPWFSFLVSEDVRASEVEEEASKGEKEKWIELQSWQFVRAEAFNMLSNILKTRHDTVKNSVNNIR